MTVSAQPSSAAISCVDIMMQPAVEEKVNPIAQLVPSLPLVEIAIAVPIKNVKAVGMKKERKLNFNKIIMIVANGLFIVLAIAFIVWYNTPYYKYVISGS